ncbi:MAG TPA: PilT/PilU family type 4a pilus ATPase [Candidatus Acidoferrales bacterium]|nr:PilT/PilU family type 4a pilus ATPase [Candidatus Acidoferrales bacterium]
MEIARLLGEMVKRGASDLYITVDSKPMLRIHGTNHPVGDAMLSPTLTESLADSLMSDNERQVFHSTKEMNLGISIPNLGRFRVNVLRQRNSVGMVIREIKTTIPTLDDLQLPGVLKEIVMAKRGLVLVVGATGSGKSTSLAAMIDHRNANTAGHIITVEDPIEFVHPNKGCIVTQREVGADTDSFHAALKNTLRQAPDVILIGEIRDSETMEAGLTFAETGHLCLGTLHSSNANQAIQRVLSFFTADRHPEILLQMSLNLRAVISQRLIPSTDGKRAAALEVLLDTPWIKEMIKKGEVDRIKEGMERGTGEGCQIFDDALLALYSEGRITFDQAIANADSANNLRLKIKNADAKRPTPAAAALRVGGSPEGSALSM